MHEQERFRGALLGLACGDAVGTTVEFAARGTFAPVTDMVGGGPFGLQAGQWTDDTSMALCLATSLVEKAGFDAQDQMERYVAWWQQGYLSSTGSCFDIGNTTVAALGRYQNSRNPYSGSMDGRSAGNGSIMRLAPIALYFYPDLHQTIHFAGESSRTTHAAPECVAACQLLGAMLYKALAGYSKEEVLFGSHFPTPLPAPLPAAIQALANGAYRQRTRDEIVGNGYVVTSLEAALWSFWQTDSYEAAILQAVNLGEDADTTAAVCGQLAGAFYGATAIPAHWLQRLTLRAEITGLADQLWAANRP